MRLSRVGIGEDTLYILIIATIIIWHDLFYNNSRKQNPAQGRIQDLKLGVAQMDWEILKTGGGLGGYIKY